MIKKIVAILFLIPAVPFVVLYVLLNRFAWWLIDVPRWIERGVEKYCDFVRRIIL